MNLTFRQLKVFEVLVRHRNYTKAAQELYLSQPAVSMQVKQLEEQVELPLLEKIGKKLYLTEAGEEIYQYARNTLQKQRDTEEIIEQLKDLQRGHLNIAVASTANHFVIRLLGQFAKLYPKIRISLDVTNRSSLLTQLDNNERDLVIMGKPPKDQQLQYISFLENPLVVVSSPHHPLTTKKAIRLHELSHYSFVVREIGSGTRDAIERFFHEHKISFRTSMDMSNNNAIKRAVEEDLGLGIVSLHTLAMELKMETLKVLNIEGFPIIRHWYVVQKEDKRLPPITQEFKDYLIAQANAVLPCLHHHHIA